MLLPSVIYFNGVCQSDHIERLINLFTTIINAYIYNI